MSEGTLVSCLALNVAFSTHRIGAKQVFAGGTITLIEFREAVILRIISCAIRSS